jgi:hypothetical protein
MNRRGRKLSKTRDFSAASLVGPQSAEKELGFTGCGKTLALYQGTTLVVP